MRHFSKNLFIALAACLGIYSLTYAQVGTVTPELTWPGGTAKLKDRLNTNQLTVTGPSAGFYYDVTVQGMDIYGEEAGDMFNGADEFGFVIGSGFQGPLQGPGAMNRPAETSTLGPWRWTIPNEGRLHNLPPGGYSLTINYYDSPPGPDATLLGSMTARPITYVNVIADLQIIGLETTADTYTGGDFMTVKLSVRNGDGMFGYAEPESQPALEARPIRPDINDRIKVNFILSIDPVYDGPNNPKDDFLLDSVFIFGDGKSLDPNIREIREMFLDPAESYTYEVDLLVPRNYPGVFYLDAEIDVDDDVLDITEANNVASISRVMTRPSTLTARVHIQPNNSPITHPVSEVTNRNGVQVNSANEYSDFPSVSGDGSLIAFESLANNLVPGDNNNCTDILLRHRDSGRLQLASVSSKGVPGNGHSLQPSLSEGGRFIAFSSYASNLVKEDSAGFADIFVHDIETGQTIRVSTGILQVGSVVTYLDANGSSFAPSISGDGRFVAFASFATNLDPEFVSLFPPGGTPVRQIYVHDRAIDGDLDRLDKTGNTGTYIVSVNRKGELGNDNSFTPCISHDGNWVVFSSFAQNFNKAATEGDPDLFESNTFQQIFRRKTNQIQLTLTGTTTKTFHDLHDTLELVSANTDGEIGNSDSYQPAINGDTSKYGVHVAFASDADNLDLRMLDRNNVPDIFVRDIRDSLAPNTIRVSISSGGNEAIDVEGHPGDPGSVGPSIDSTGRYVAFRSNADNIVHLSPLRNGTSDIFLHDRDYDANEIYDEVYNSGILTEVVSTNRFGFETNVEIRTQGTSGSSRNASISPDGRFVAFVTDAEGMGGLRFGRTNQLPLDNNNFRDVFLHDRNITVINTTIPELYPPYVIMLQPNNGDQFATGSTFFIRAYATDTSGTTDETAGIQKVDIIVNGDIVAVDFTEPFSTTYTPLEEGSYSIRARATDKDGYVTFSDPLNVTAVVSSSRLPEVELPYPRDGQAFLPNQDVPFLAEILGDPNISGATFQSLDFYVDGLSVASGVLQPGGLYQTIHKFLTPGEQNLNAVVQYQSTTQPGVTIQAISNTVTVDILAETGSLPPTVQILYPADRSSITSSSSIRLLAEASDPDGNLVGVQFYVNGVAYENEVLRTPSHTPNKFPFGRDWSPDSAGSFEITAVARDSSGNFATSFPIRVNSATGVNPPTVEFTQPFTPPTVTTSVEEGVITSIDLVHGKEGNGFFDVPEVVITGLRNEAVFAISSADIQNGGIFPTQDPLNPYLLPARPSDRGSGYVRTPSVIIVGDGTGARAFAQKGVDGGIDRVIIREPGVNYTSARVNFSGGHSDAEVEAQLTGLGGGIQSLNLLNGGTGYISGRITHVSVTKTGSDYRTAPIVYISPPPNEDKGGQTAEAVAEVNFDGQVHSIILTDGGSGYDTVQSYSGNTFTFRSSNNLLTSSATDFLLFLQSLVRSGDLTVADIIYDSIRIRNSGVNDGEYSVVAVSPAGIEVFPNLADESAGATVTLRAEPAPPTVTIIGGEGSGARAEAVVAAPAVNFREVRTIPGAQTDSPIVLTANAEDDGVVTRTEFYANGIPIPSSFADTAYWTPQNTGIYDVVAIAIDDDGNSTASTAIEFRITEPESTLPGVTLVSPVSINSQAPSFAVNSSIDLTAYAYSSTGTIATVAFYADNTLVGTSTTPIGTKDDGHFTASWTPTTPGSYTLTAYARDNLGQVAGLESPQTINVINAVGATAPSIDLVYPEPSIVTTTTTDPVTGLATTTTRVNPTYITDKSSIRIAATANDPDGGLNRVRFYVNGVEVPSITGYLKLDDNVPADGDTIQFDDGINSPLTFEFDSDGSVFLGRVAVTIGADIGTTRNTFVGKLEQAESDGSLLLDVYPVGTAGVFLEHLTPRGLDASLLGITTSFQDSSNVFARGLSNGVVRFPTSNPEDHPFSVEWAPGTHNGPGIYTIHAVAEDNSGNKVMSSAVSVTCTAGSGEEPSIALASVSENNLLVISPTTGAVVNPNPFAPPTTGNTGAWTTIYVAEIDDPDGEVTQVEYFVNGQSIGVDDQGKHQMQWTPPDIGMYEVHAHAKDDRGNTTATDVQKLLIVHQGTTDTGIVNLEDEKPFIDLMSPLDGTKITIGNSLDLVALAKPSESQTNVNTQTYTIQRVDFFANNKLVGSALTYPYRATYSPTSFGVYHFMAIATNIKGIAATSKTVTVQVVQNPLTRPTNYLRPFSMDTSPDAVTADDFRREGDFVLAVYRDLVWMNPTSGEYQSMINDLVYERVTRVELVEKIMKGPYYGSFRDMTMAQFVLKQIWPDRADRLFNYSLSEKGVIETPPPVDTLDVLYPDPRLDTMTSTMVGLVDFGIKNPNAGNAPAANNNNNNNNNNNAGPVRLSGLDAVVEYYKGAFDLTYGTFDEKENGDFFELLFENKYGVSPTPLQGARGQKVLNKKFEEMGGILDPSKINMFGGGNQGGRGGRGGRGNQNNNNNNNNNIFGFGGNNNNLSMANIQQTNLVALDDSRTYVVREFIRDNTFISAGEQLFIFMPSLVYTEDLKIPFPPNNRLVELADANILNIGIMRQPASAARNEEIRAIGSLSEQILYAINSDYFKDRFSVEDFSGGSSSSADDASNNIASAWSGASMLSDGWMNLDWFGVFYYGKAPWLYHHELGWIYNSTGTPTDIWLWKESIGWCWTSKDQFPYLYSADHGWLFYQQGTGNMFYSFQGAKWLTF